MKQKTALILVATVVYSTIITEPFAILWQQMRDQYANVQDMAEPSYSHDFWRATVHEIQAVLQGQPRQNFLVTDPLLRTMLRTVLGPMQRYELSYLDSMRNKSIKSLIGRYRDTSFGGVPLALSAKGWSVSTLGHLFYTARILEKCMPAPASVIELGGGYGNMARIFKQLFPESIYIIIDLPEILALQWLFLKGSCQDEIHLCRNVPKVFQKGIYLIPNNLIADLSLHPDLFVSNFALSECSCEMQESVIEKRFFGARAVYITGQLENKWQEGWVPHHYLKNAAEKLYHFVQFSPFQEGKTNDHSYELIAN